MQVAAPPGCETAAREFYGGLLGLDEIPKPAPLAGRGGVWFRCGAQQVHVGVEEPFTPSRKAHPALAVSDERALDAIAARLAPAGCELHWDDAVPDVRRFYTDDPWGNRLELVAVSSRR